MTKVVALAGLTFVYVLILLVVAEAAESAPPPLPHLLTVALCGAIGASLANGTRWLINLGARRNPTRHV